MVLEIRTYKKRYICIYSLTEKATLIYILHIVQQYFYVFHIPKHFVWNCLSLATNGSLPMHLKLVMSNLFPTRKAWPLYAVSGAVFWGQLHSDFVMRRPSAHNWTEQCRREGPGLDEGIRFLQWPLNITSKTHFSKLSAMQFLETLWNKISGGCFFKPEDLFWSFMILIFLVTN